MVPIDVGVVVGASARKAVRNAFASVMVTAERALSSMMKRAEAGSEHSWV